MPSASAKPRPRKRPVLRCWTEEGRGQFPGGPPADLPSPGKVKPRGCGQPPKTPAGTWEDDDLFEQVENILGDADERADHWTAIREALCRLARERLGPEQFTDDRRDDLCSLARKTITMKIASLEITRQLLVWQHDLTDPAVRRMRSRKPVAHDFTALVLNYTKYDKQGRPDGPPICNDDGQPILWVPDEHGQPSRPCIGVWRNGQFIANEPLPRRSVKTVRPHVKMIFR